MVVLSKNKWYFGCLVGMAKALRYKEGFMTAQDLEPGQALEQGIQAGGDLGATVIPCPTPAWFVTASEMGYTMFTLLQLLSSVLNNCEKKNSCIIKSENI